MRPAFRALLVLVPMLLAAASLSGCFGSTDATLSLTPYVAVNLGGAGRVSQYALLVENTGAYREDASVSAEGLPEGWKANFSDTALHIRGGSSGHVLRVDVTPKADAAPGLYTFRVRVGDVQTPLALRVVRQGLLETRARLGVQVRIAAFYDNGTLFANNLQEVKGAGFHKALLGDESNLAPFKVLFSNEANASFIEAGYAPLAPALVGHLQGLRQGETRIVHIEKQAPDFPVAVGSLASLLSDGAVTLIVVVESVDELPQTTPAAPCPFVFCSG